MFRLLFHSESRLRFLRMGLYAILDKKWVLSDLFSPLYIMFLSPARAMVSFSTYFFLSFSACAQKNDDR